MLVVKTVKRIVIADICDIFSLCEFISKNLDSKFCHFLPEKTNEINEFLVKTPSISFKNVRIWYKKTLNGGVSQFSKKFWICRGWSKNEAEEKIRFLQKENVSKKIEKLQKKQLNHDDSWKSSFNTTPQFFQKKFGVNLETATKMLSERQVTFSLQKCISKYGETEGTKVWEKRQKKWISTLTSKSDAEKDEIRRKQVVPLGKASRESLAIFLPITKLLLDKRICQYSDIFFGFEDRKEWFLADSFDFFLYDFCIPKLKLILEYQEKIWHPDYRLNENEILKWENPHGVKAVDCLKNDKKKREFAEKRGFEVVYLWGQNTPKENMKIAFDAIKNALSKVPFSVKITDVGRLLSEANVKVDSPFGFVNVSDFLEQGKKECYDVLFASGERITCSDDHLFRHENGQWVSVRNIFATKNTSLAALKCQIKNGVSPIIAISSVGEKEVFDLTVDHDEHAYFTNEIVSHNCGKTLLTLAAGLSQVVGKDSKYEHLVVSRPVQPMGKDIGFLPGTLEEKMDPWVAPIKDNLSFLLGNKFKKQVVSKKHGEPDREFKRDPYIEMFFEDKIEIEALTYIRGRSIPNSFMIIDECQNLTIHELKTIITRIGDGTKIILLGDIEQIDNTSVDMFTNGLTYAVEKFKDYRIAGHITLLKGERSELATLAAKIL